MTGHGFLLRSCGWYVAVFHEATSDDAGLIAECLTADDFSERAVEAVAERVCGLQTNGGFTYTLAPECVSVVVTARTTTADEFANTYDHEKGHLVRHIAKSCRMEPYSEREQYLAGEVAQRMFPHARRYLCDHCRATTENFRQIFL